MNTARHLERGVGRSLFGTFPPLFFTKRSFVLLFKVFRHREL